MPCAAETEYSFQKCVQFGIGDMIYIFAWDLFVWAIVSFDIGRHMLPHVVKPQASVVFEVLVILRGLLLSLQSRLVQMCGIRGIGK